MRYLCAAFCGDLLGLWETLMFSHILTLDSTPPVRWNRAGVRSCVIASVRPSTLREVEEEGFPPPVQLLGRIENRVGRRVPSRPPLCLR